MRGGRNTSPSLLSATGWRGARAFPRAWLPKDSRSFPVLPAYARAFQLAAASAKPSQGPSSLARLLRLDQDGRCLLPRGLKGLAQPPRMPVRLWPPLSCRGMLGAPSATSSLLRRAAGRRGGSPYSTERGPSSSSPSSTGDKKGSVEPRHHDNLLQRWRTSERRQQRNTNLGFILTTLILGGLALSYTSVPLYQRFCQATGYGGTTRRLEVDLGDREEEARRQARWRKRAERPLTIKFYSNTNSNIPWVFYPLQTEVGVVPGESTLAFYRADNPSSEDIVGIASYNVVPAKAGIYFQKIQCFCFEEQLLPAKKGVDMPVYFVIDPDFADDPNMHDVESISLFYTFFRAKDFDSLNAKAYDEAQQKQQQEEEQQRAEKVAAREGV